MANDLLIQAIRENGLDDDQIADIAGVDPKTVERWLAGRIPYPRYRALLAQRLGLAEAELWPETARVRGRTGLEEIVGAWPRRDDKDAPNWRALLRQANRQVDLIGYSLHSFLDSRVALKALAGKAADGCSVRIAIADPESEHVLAAELLDKGSGRLRQRIRASRERLLELAGQPNLAIREHRVATSHTILRFDEHMLLTIHLAGTPGIHAPLLHIDRRRDYAIYDQLAGHIETVWQVAKLIRRPDEQPEVAPPPPARTGADAVLDRLDNVWRPGS